MPALSGFAGPNALRGFGYQPEPERSGVGGILRTLVEETAQDVIGGGRTLVAPVGSLLEMLGATVPVTIDDLTGRDLKGAAMIAAMVVAGALPRAAGRLLPGLMPFVAPATKTMTAMQRTKALAVSESIAGAAFGLTRTALDPTEDDYLNNMLGDAAVFGALGAGFSLVGAGTKATFNIFKAVDRTAKRKAEYLAAEGVQNTRRKIQEFAGQGFRNPDTQEIAYVWRDEVNGELNTMYFKLDANSQTYHELRKARAADADFGKTSTAIFRLGYTEPVGVMRPGEALGETSRFANIDAPEVTALVERGLVPAEDYAALKSSLGSSSALRELDILQWQKFYVGARYKSETQAAYNKLLHDALTRRVNEFGVPVADVAMTEKQAAAILEQLSGTERRRWLGPGGRVKTDAQGRVPPRVATEITQEAMRQGLFDFQNMNLSMGLEEIIDWLPYRVVPEGFAFTPDPNRASALIKILSGSTIGKQHPEIKPLIDESYTRDKAMEIFNHDLNRFIETTQSEVRALGPFGPREESLVRARIDQSGEVAYEALAASTKTFQIGEEHLTYAPAYAKLSQLAASGNLTEEQTLLLTQLHQAWVDTAGRKAIEAAKGQGPAVEYVVKALVEPTTGFFSRNLTLLQDSGLVAMGKPGYFPIYNRGNFIVTVQRPGGKLEVLSKDGIGFFDSFDEAEKAFQAELRAGRATSGGIRNALSEYQARGTNVTPQQHATLMQREAEGQHIRIDSSGRPIFSERRFGGREFENIGLWDAVALYGRSVNKKLAFSQLPARLLDPADKQFYHGTLDNFLKMRLGAAGEALPLPARLQQLGLDQGYVQRAATHLAAVPQAKGVLYQWGAQLRDDMLGLPRQHEIAIDSILTKLGAAPRATKRYLGFLRSYENFFRLGGLGSAPVQVTQLLTNVPPELGLGRTAGTLAKYMGRAQGFRPDDILPLMMEAGIDPQFVASFAKEGTETFWAQMHKIVDTNAPSLRKRLNTAAAWDAVHTLFLTPFTTAERMNRMITFKAAFDKGIVEGKVRADALSYASEIMYKTQFNYHVSDMPELLRGPLGATIFQFKSFFVKEMEFIASLTPTQQAEFAGLLSALGGVGTLLNIPGPDLLSVGKGLFFDENLDETLKIDGLSSIGIPKDSDISKLLLHGLPGLLLNTDMSDRISMGGFSDLLDFWGGPILSDMKAFKDFTFAAVPQLLKTGDLQPEIAYAWLNRAMPTEMRRVWLTYDFMRTGEYRDFATRKLIYRSDDRFQQLTSFVAPSLELSQERAAEHVTTKMVTRFRAQLQKSAKEVADAYLAKEPERARAAIEDAHRHGIRLEPRHWNYWIKQRQRTGAERRLRRTPAQLRNTEEFQALFEATGDVTEPLEL